MSQEPTSPESGLNSASDARDYDHSFGQQERRPGEKRTLIVIIITLLTMVVEITAGIMYGSMALLADGLHMASHALALGITWAAYIYARRHARDPRYTFGTGKVNALAGFTSALLLAGFALVMVWESTHRFIDPVAISFDQAIAVAILGLVVNGISVAILGVKGDHGHSHGHEHGHEHEHEHGHEHDHDRDQNEGQEEGHSDQNLRAAYLHVLADALTSVLAIVALLAGKYLDQQWMDPAMGIVGAILVGRWSIGLLRDTARILLDHQAPKKIYEGLRTALSADGVEVCDLHVWAIGPGIYAAAITLECDDHRPIQDYHRLIPAKLKVAHATIEVSCPCSD